jgi:hypothetical protein
MNDVSDSGNPYSAPTKFTALVDRDSSSLWGLARIGLWALASPPLAWLWLHASISPLGSTIFFLCFLFGPALLLLWPHLRVAGLGGVSLKHLILSVGAGLGVFALSAACFFVVGWVWFWFTEWR